MQDILLDFACLLMPASFICMACQISPSHWCDREGDSFFFLKEMKERRSEASRLIKGHGEGQCWSRSCSRCTCMHYHSFTVCHPPLFCHSLSLFLPPTFSFHPRPTFLVVGVVLRLELSERNTKQNWDRFSMLHRSLWWIASFHVSTVMFPHSAPQVCFVPWLRPPVLHINMFPFHRDMHIIH